MENHSDRKNKTFKITSRPLRFESQNIGSTLITRMTKEFIPATSASNVMFPCALCHVLISTTPCGISNHFLARTDILCTFMFLCFKVNLKLEQNVLCCFVPLKNKIHKLCWLEI